MTSFLAELTRIIENMNNIPYGEIMQFASTIDKRVVEEVKYYESCIDKIKKSYKLFSEHFVPSHLNKLPKIKSIAPTSDFESVTRKIGNVTLNCPLIKTHKEALKFPYKPCCMADVPEWYFIAFPDLGQILPVTYIDSMFSYKQDAQHTRINFNLFNSIDPVTLHKSNFAVFPYTNLTWNLFEKIDKKQWNNYLRQLNICHLSQDNKRGQYIALNTTNCLLESATNVKPEEMATQWSIFAQFYFILYLFRIAGGKEHFTI